MIEKLRDSPLISVITVSYNAFAFIDQTIQSVCGQSYPHIEYIIIDGGSQDGTQDIIRKYESRLAYWHAKPDRGITHAFNLGLAQAHGDWIIFLNADDYFIDQNVLEKMSSHLTSNAEADVVFGQVALIPQNNLFSDSFPPMVIVGDDWHWKRFRFVGSIPHQGAFTHRRYFEKFGLFDERFRIGMDYEHYLRGGKDLTAIFVPVLISAMRIGGVSSHVFATLKEWHAAQLQHKIAPPLYIWGNYLARYLWNRFRQNVLGRKYDHYLP